MSYRTNYWVECLAEAFSKHGISATDSQIRAVADDVEGSVENISMAFPTPENPLIDELKRTKDALATERRKEVCPKCNGRGSITTPGPYHSMYSQCWKCHGEGKVLL